MNENQNIQNMPYESSLHGPTQGNQRETKS